MVNTQRKSLHSEVKSRSGAGLRQLQRTGHWRRGLTLTEILVVIAILAILASVLAVNYTGILSSAKHKIAMQEMVKLKETLEQYKLLAGDYPSQQDGLNVLIKPLPGQSEPLINAPAVLDPWGHAYVYVIPGQHGKYDLVSLGADGIEGGDGENADIHSWDDLTGKPVTNSTPVTP